MQGFLSWAQENKEWLFSGVGFAIFACLFRACVTITKKKKPKKKHIFKLSVPEGLIDPKIVFNVLHVRDGKDEVNPGKDELLNKEIKLKQSKTGTLFGSTRYQKNLGFQYKYFVDYVDTDYETIKALLGDAGYVGISKSAGSENRIFFLDPEVETCRTVDGFINNFKYPA